MTYTQKDIKNLTGMSPSIINYYVRELAVIPEINKGEGRGHSRKYSEYNKLQFIIISKLNKLGISIGIIKNLMNQLDILMLITNKGERINGTKADISIGDEDVCIVVNVANLIKTI